MVIGPVAGVNSHRSRSSKGVTLPSCQNLLSKTTLWLVTTSRISILSKVKTTFSAGATLKLSLSDMPVTVALVNVNRKTSVAKLNTEIVAVCKCVLKNNARKSVREQSSETLVSEKSLIVGRPPDIPEVLLTLASVPSDNAGELVQAD